MKNERDEETSNRAPETAETQEVGPKRLWLSVQRMKKVRTSVKGGSASTPSSWDEPEQL